MQSTVESRISDLQVPDIPFHPTCRVVRTLYDSPTLTLKNTLYVTSNHVSV